MSDLEYVRAKLRDSKGQWLRISKETGVAHRAIYNIVRDLNDPRSSTINALALWFRERDAEQSRNKTAPRGGATDPQDAARASIPSPLT